MHTLTQKHTTCCTVDANPCHLTAAGADYASILSQVLTFNSTVMLLPITLHIVVDQLVEHNETLSAILELENGLHRVELSPILTNITIDDSDSK